jgi:SIR2-like domain
MPDAVVDSCLKYDLVVFAGAGASTESSSLLPWTFYSEVAGAVGAPSDASFPQVMTMFEESRGRPELLQLARKRFDYIEAFRGLRYDATRFHRELATLFYVDTIVTTNWDTYFESECGATPIVTPPDYAFWSLKGRKVFKIHGSMNNVGSIIATEADYEACYQSLREGVIGSTLKHLLATKTIVFVGYSFRDEDFERVYGLIQDQLGAMLRRPVIVTLDEEFDDSRFPGATLVLTDGAYFIEELKRLVRGKSDCLLADEQFDGLDVLLEDVREEHLRLQEEIPMKTYPMVIYAMSYQDGLMDALERILTMRGSGTYSHTCDTHKMVHRYLDMQRVARRRKRYWDLAYIEGYINGMIFLLSQDPDRWAIPLVYVPGAPDDASIKSRRQLKKLLADTSLHKAAFRAAKRIADRYGDDIVVHHRPTLLGLS